mmetsp:Transcript_24765/g.79768  ORF Transcript_24765/g.79768 Transcript_24765/m.79768 type:complete len:236 (-) Transcript_24765:1073-1780(-)
MDGSTACLNSVSPRHSATDMPAEAAVTPPAAPGVRPLIIFDWDDTLLASSWLAGQGLRLDSPAVLPDEVLDQLEELEEAIIKVLSRACSVGHVIIITNAEQGWVELSAKRFVPGVLPYLSSVTVLSARTTFESAFPGSPLDWKVQAFSTKVKEYMAVGAGVRSVISFGDSVHERDAVHKACSVYREAWTKSVKFVEKPTVEQLRREIELVCSCFDYICTYQNHLDLMLTIQLLSS